MCFVPRLVFRLLFQLLSLEVEFLFPFVLRAIELGVADLQLAHDRVQLQMQGSGVPVLGVLDDEDHQERHDGGACVDDKLPRIGEAEQRAACGPEHQDHHCRREDPGVAEDFGAPAGETGEEAGPFPARGSGHWNSPAAKARAMAALTAAAFSRPGSAAARPAAVSA